MFTKLEIPGFGGSEGVVFRCVCGLERNLGEGPAAEGRYCVCGRTIPAAVKIGNAEWKTYLEHRKEIIRAILETGALKELPEGERAMARKMFGEQLRKLEDGTWRHEAKKQLAMYRGQVAAMEGAQPLMREPAHVEMVRQMIKRLEEELEAAGEAIEHNEAEATDGSIFGVGGGDVDESMRVKVSRDDWDQYPLEVAQKVATALAMRIEPADMRLEQRALVFAWVFHRAGFKQHGTTLFNSLEKEANIPDVLSLTAEALQNIGATAHLQIFEKALARWRSKPRMSHAEDVDTGSVARHHEEFSAVCDEFLDLDEEADATKPSLESHLIEYLRNHEGVFVRIVP